MWRTSDDGENECCVYATFKQTRRLITWSIRGSAPKLCCV